MTNYLKLKDSDVEFLQNQPESGMGYHIINVFLKDGSVLDDRRVANCKYLDLEENETLKLEDIHFISFQTIPRKLLPNAFKLNYRHFELFSSDGYDLLKEKAIKCFEHALEQIEKDQWFNALHIAGEGIEHSTAALQSLINKKNWKE